MMQNITLHTVMFYMTEVMTVLSWSDDMTQFSRKKGSDEDEILIRCPDFQYSIIPITFPIV